MVFVAIFGSLVVVIDTSAACVATAAASASVAATWPDVTVIAIVFGLGIGCIHLPIKS